LQRRFLGHDVAGSSVAAVESCAVAGGEAQAYDGSVLDHPLEVVGAAVAGRPERSEAAVLDGPLVSAEPVGHDVSTMRGALPRKNR
jgi:hypothetical protein